MQRSLCILLILASLLLAGSSMPAVAQAQSTSEEDTDTDTVAPESAASALQENNNDIAAKEAEIASLNQKITELQAKKENTAEEASLIASQLQLIRERLAKAQLELRRTQLSIGAVKSEQLTTEEQVAQLTEQVEEKREQLRQLIRLLYEKEQQSLIRVFLESSSLSAVLAERTAVEELQNRSIGVMKELKAQADALQAKKAQLQQQEQDLTELHQVLAAQQSELDNQKVEQAEFLQAKKEEQAQYEQKIAAAKAAREEISANLFALKNANVQVTFTSAADMAKFASKLTGVRPALLLAVLKVESNVGTNIGSGVYPDDMQPASRDAFERLAEKLGRSTSEMPISRAPSYGWGGAMGPAQIMPQTWEGIEPRLAQLLKKAQPDPYDLTDAFVATALLLADKGATSSSGEKEAVGRYLAGPNWQRFPWYTDRVFAVVAEYEKEGL